jgi:hypothetical protein
LEAVLRLLRRQVRDRRLSSDHELQLGNEVHDELTEEIHLLEEDEASSWPRGKNEACLTGYRECNWPVYFLRTGDRSTLADVLIDVDHRRRNSGEGMMR